MKTQLSIQEKLEDLRKERKLTQDIVAAAVGIAGSTLSKYENKENKEYNIAILNSLADYYGVSLEWLVGNTEVRESTSTEIDELMLDDETIDLLKSGRFNNRLLCEIIKHPDFIKLMTDTEIYVDGIATMQIKNMNDWLDAVRLQIIQQKNPDANDLYLSKSSGKLAYPGGRILLPYHSQRLGQYYPHYPCKSRTRCRIHTNRKAYVQRQKGAAFLADPQIQKQPYRGILAFLL